jgi:hypothetical protein
VQELGALLGREVRGGVESVVNDGREDPAEFLVHQALAGRPRWEGRERRAGGAAGRGFEALRPIFADGVD